MEPVVIDRAGLKSLIEALRALGYAVVGPTVRDGAVVYDEISSVEDLPEGWTDEQDAGTYRLRRRDDSAFFGYAVGPQSWKRYLFPPRTLLWSARRAADGFEVREEREEPPRFAFLGVRPCELKAMEIQDRVFLAEGHEDPTYAARRRSAFVVAVNCGVPASTCFCASMGTGPRADGGFDLSLTEVIEEGRHEFVVEAGTEEGADVIGRLSARPAEQADLEAARRVTDGAAAAQRRHLDTDGLPELLAATHEHPQWDDVASRCLSCTNCTMVCPTCFCSTVEDQSDLSGERAERWRRWDSCYTLDFTFLGGGSVRSSGRSRYRQWLTHKVGTWVSQFGTSGCVGCGRCITWCPVGIDLTEEIRRLRDPAPAPVSGPQEGS